MSDQSSNTLRDEKEEKAHKKLSNKQVKEVKEVKEVNKDEDDNKASKKLSSKVVKELNDEETRAKNKVSTSKVIKETKDQNTSPANNTEDTVPQTKVSNKNTIHSDNQTNQRLSELEAQLRDADEKLKLMTEDKNKQIEAKNQELLAKEKSLQSLSITNKKLITNLESMKKEVDEKLEKISMKAIHEKMKHKGEKENPLEIVVKIKENEIKNAHAMNQILKQDLKKKELTEKLDYYNAYIEATDRIKYEEKKNEDLRNEIKLCKRQDEEYKRNVDKIKDFEKERKNFRDEIQKLKEKTKDLSNTLKEEENKFNQMTTKLNNKIYESEGKASKRRSLTPKNRKTNPEKIEKDEKTSKDNNRDNRTSKKYIKNDKSNVNIYSRNSKLSEEEKTLFTPDQLVKIETVLDGSEIERLEKKYETAVNAKYSLDNKLKSDTKTSNKTIVELQEQLEFINIQLKESDQKNKINLHQINEMKQDNKQLNKKLNETQTNLDGLSKILREKEQENNIILNQLNTLKKISKHNILAPLDTEYSKREKSKMSELNDSNFSPPRNNKLEDIDKLNNSKNDNEIDVVKSKASVEHTEENNEESPKLEDDERYNLRPQKNKGLDN